MPAPIYTTLAKVQKLLSADGLNRRVDDDPVAWQDAADEASGIIEEHLLPCYAESSLPGNRWVEYACRCIAAVLLCERRGNTAPPSTQARYEYYMGRLELVRLGQLNVPRMARVRIDAPTLASPRVRVGPLGPRVVIDRGRGPVRNQPQDYAKNDERYEPFDPMI